MYLGMRFGYAVWAYIPMLLASCYLCADAPFFMAEATLPDVLNEVHTISQNRLSMVQDRLSWPRRARPRKKRFAYALLTIVISYLFYLFVILPWGLCTLRGRPDCEAGKTTSTPGASWAPRAAGCRLGRRGTSRHPDYPIFVLIIEGIHQPGSARRATTAPSAAMHRPAAPSIRIVENAKLVQNATKIRVVPRSSLPLILGSIVMILGQAISGARSAWPGPRASSAKRCTPTRPPASRSPPSTPRCRWSTTRPSPPWLTVVVGLVIGAALQRHLINGVGCFSATLFAWLALIFALPLLVYANVRSVFNQGPTRMCRLSQQRLRLPRAHARHVVDYHGRHPPVCDTDHHDRLWPHRGRPQASSRCATRPRQARLRGFHQAFREDTCAHEPGFEYGNCVEAVLLWVPSRAPTSHSSTLRPWPRPTRPTTCCTRHASSWPPTRQAHAATRQRSALGIGGGLGGVHGAGAVGDGVCVCVCA